MASGRADCSLSRPRHQFLSRAGLTYDQDRRIGRGDSGDHIPHGKRRRTGAKDLRRTLQPIDGQLQQIVFPQQLCVLACSADCRADNLRLKRLGDEVEGTLAHALNGKFYRSKSGQKDDR